MRRTSNAGGRMGWRIGVVALLAAGGCAASSLTQESGVPLKISVETTQVKLGDPNVTIRVEVRNLGAAALTLRVRCSVIELDRLRNGEWNRFGDFRLCALPDRTTLGAWATMTAADQRSLSPGQYRVAIETVEGLTAYSEPFEVAAIR